jgi:hypothetical protein
MSRGTVRLDFIVVPEHEWLQDYRSAGDRSTLILQSSSQNSGQTIGMQLHTDDTSLVGLWPEFREQTQLL